MAPRPGPAKRQRLEAAPVSPFALSAAALVVSFVALVLSIVAVFD